MGSKNLPRELKTLDWLLVSQSQRAEGNLFNSDGGFHQAPSLTEINLNRPVRILVIYVFSIQIKSSFSSRSKEKPTSSILEYKERTVNISEAKESYIENLKVEKPNLEYYNTQ